MKKLNISLLLIISLLSILSAQGMEKDSIELNNLNNQIKEAIEYNKNHKLLNKDLFGKIIDYWTKPGNATYVPKTEMHILYGKKFSPSRSEIAHQQIQTLLALHTTSQYLNRLVPFDTIITFCKKLDFEVKNNILMMVLREYFGFFPDNNRICSALIRAKANAILTYQDIPLFFYAKSKEMAEEFIMRGCNIHTITKDQINVLSHVTAKEYPSDLMEFYLSLRVIPQQRAIHSLAHALKGHCAHEYLRKEFLQKCALLLNAAHQRIKDDLNREKKTPLDKLYEQLEILGAHEDDVPEFQKIALETFLSRVLDLFVYHGCHRKSDIKDTGWTIDDLESYPDPEINMKHEIFIGQPAHKPDYELTFEDEAIFAIHDDEYIEEKENIKDVTNIETANIIPIEEIINIANERDKSGNTRLIQAVLENNIVAVRELLKWGANPEEPSSDGRTALEIAMENGDDDIAALLIDACETKLGG